ncbi:MAG: dTDP-glucose 4,6-dehydratase, partial [Spirochaetaceae bacterium]
MRALQNVLVTGGAGFIGSNFIHYLFAQPEFSGRVINIDALTYAGNLDNLTEIEQSFGGADSTAPARYVFEHCDIRDSAAVAALFEHYQIDTVVHLAAESHVDRSISGPRAFIETNVIGTFNLLEAARSAWGGVAGGGRGDVLFHHVSTDEVFGSLGDEGAFSEQTAYDPRSPYSASKAGSDHLVRAYGHTYALPFTLSNCSNNYGPYQFPEKMVPLMILNALEGKQLPVYGQGTNVRDWLYVKDHADAIWRILQRGRSGRTYLIGGENEWQNLRLVHAI